MEEEQHKLDKKMDKRRRVQEWQEERKKKEESEKEKGEEPEQETSKRWSLDSNDEETAPVEKSENDHDASRDA